MEIGKSCRMFFIIFWVVVLFAGCSCSGGGSDSQPESQDYWTYTTSGSDLVVQIPDTLTVSQENVEEIHYYADQVAHCRTATRVHASLTLERSSRPTRPASPKKRVSTVPAVVTRSDALGGVVASASNGSKTW